MYKSILQTKQWAQLKEKYGQKPHWISDVLVLEHKLPLKKCFLYAPEIDQVQLHDMDKPKLDELAKKTGALFARVEIANPVSQRADYLNESLKDFIKSRDEIQPKHRQIIDIRQAEEIILGQMKSKGRYNIRVAERHNIKVEGYKAEGTHRAANIDHEMSFWGKSDNKKSQKPIIGNQEDVILSPGRAKNLSASTTSGDPSVASTLLQDDTKLKNDEIALSPTGARNDNQDAVRVFHKLYMETVKREGITGRNIDYFYDLVDILGASDCAQVFIAYLEDQPLASAIVTFYDGVASYLYGGSSREHKEVMAPFAMHWAIIKEAKKRNCHHYDLLGVAPEGDGKHKWAGLTRFKENFGGRNVEIIGSYDKVYDLRWYKLFRAFRKN